MEISDKATPVDVIKSEYREGKRLQIESFHQELSFENSEKEKDSILLFSLKNKTTGNLEKFEF